MKDFPKMTVEDILLKAEERLGLAGKPEEPGPEDTGVVSISPGELTLKDLVVDPDIKYLPDVLAIFAPASEIIRMHNEFKKHPHLKRARKADCDGSCEDCDRGTGGDCSTKKG